MVDDTLHGEAFATRNGEMAWQRASKSVNLWHMSLHVSYVYFWILTFNGRGRTATAGFMELEGVALAVLP